MKKYNWAKKNLTAIIKRTNANKKLSKPGKRGRGSRKICQQEK